MDKTNVFSDSKNDIGTSLLFSSLLEATIQELNAQTPEEVTSIKADRKDNGKINNSLNKIIDFASQKYGVNVDLIREVISAESSFNAKAESSAGAQGLMQLMPGTASEYGVTDPFDPLQNVDGGTHFLSDLLDRYKGNVSLALAAYNAGPGAVKKHNGIPPYRETQAYVNKIISKLDGVDKKA